MRTDPRRVPLIGAALLGASLALSACGDAPESFAPIGAWRDLGSPIPCPPGIKTSDGIEIDYTKTALAQLDVLEPSHAPPSSITCYHPEAPDGGFNDGVAVVVFGFPDGRQRAIGIHCGVPPCFVVQPEGFYGE